MSPAEELAALAAPPVSVARHLAACTRGSLLILAALDEQKRIIDDAHFQVRNGPLARAICARIERMVADGSAQAFESLQRLAAHAAAETEAKRAATGPVPA